jgi:hypothetical protein
VCPVKPDTTLPGHKRSCTTEALPQETLYSVISIKKIAFPKINFEEKATCLYRIIMYCFSGTRARDKEATPAATSLGDFLSRPVTFPSKII